MKAENVEGLNMNEETLKSILDKHNKWLNNEPDGERANLKGANLTGANFEEANLKEANLEGANLMGANFERANLERADFRWANLKGANLKVANLKVANLLGANLRGANLTGANLDFSCWPLWCGTAGSNIKVDQRLAAQLLYHAHIIAQQYWKTPLEIEAIVKKHFHKYDTVEKLTTVCDNSAST